MSGLCDSNVYHEIQYYTSANLRPLFYIHPGIGIVFAIFHCVWQQLLRPIIEVNTSRYKYSSVTSVIY